MRKFVIFLTMFFLIAINSCEKKEKVPLQYDPIQDFLSSKDFCKNEAVFNSYGKIPIGKIQIEIYTDTSGGVAKYLMIPILRDNQIVAYIQTIKLPAGELPNNEEWAMNFIDLMMFDNPSMTGKVIMIDLNYGRVQHLSLGVINNVIKQWENLPVPEDILLKYGDVGNSKGVLKAFFACYKKQMEWLKAHDFWYFICDVFKPSCIVAESAWCMHEVGTNYRN